MMTKSTRSSRKRRRELDWSAIVKDVPHNIIPFPVFAELQQEVQMLQLKVYFGEEAQTVWQVIESNLIEPIIPPPSRMKWSDIDSVLDGVVAIDSTELLQGLPDPVPERNSYEYFKNLDLYLDRQTEAEACCRVFFMLHTILAGTSTHTMRVQPSVNSHPTFTDFLITVRNDTKALLIEVKKLNVSCCLSHPTNEVAQIFREAQIFLHHSTSLTELPIILTNASSWSFGIAKRANGRIIITSNVDYHMNWHYNQIYCLLQKLIAC